ncbi:hypothetical protein MMC15_007552 [Xylographa vitiligo]|nr:hypothetical protein [Xylographa vitiligo]
MLFRNLLPLVFLCSVSAAPTPESNIPAAEAAPFFYKGHDLSSLKMLEETGTTYRDTEKGNATRPAEAILGDGGMNTVRLRIWVDPQAYMSQPSDYDLAYTLSLASRFSAEGYRIYLDFHFSDTFADPNKQYTPAGWPSTLPALASTLRSYVFSTLSAFHTAGVPLALVSLGNEIRHGMLWPTGYVDVDTQPFPALVQNFTRLATLYKAARAGVSDAIQAGASAPQVMIHIDDGWNVTLQTRWFGALVGTGLVSPADWDVFGFSFYPFYGAAATYANLATSLDTLATLYAKPLLVVETDWPCVCDGKYEPIPDFSEPFPVSVKGQLGWTYGTVQTVRNVTGGWGQGVFYWEPAWLNNTGLGSACEDAVLFAQDFSNYPDTVGYSRASVALFRGD